MIAIEINSTADVALLGVKIAAAFAAAIWFFRLAGDLYEDWYQQRQAAKEEERKARIKDALDQAHYELSLKTASQIGPWPPERHVVNGRPRW